MASMTRRAFCGAAALSLACSRTRQPAIGVVPKGSTHIFWQAVHAGAVKAARESGYRILWNAPAQEGDRSRQIAIVESLMNQRVAGIALAPCDRTALSGVVQRAMAAGIPVVIFDSGIETTAHIGFAGTNNREGGRMAARRMGELLGGKGLAVIISDSPGSSSTNERVEGFTEVMKSRFPGVRLPGTEFCEASRAKAREIAENMLSAHPDLAAIFADHENAISGAVLAVKARERRSVKLVGFDASEPLVNDMKAGWIDALVVQNPFRMGYESVRAIDVKRKGGSPPRETDTGATLVRAADLGRPEIQELLFPRIDAYLR
jgi:ribose transport system substrate-binding protein